MRPENGDGKMVVKPTIIKLVTVVVPLLFITSRAAEAS
jgi:hypothetical protein